MAQHDVVILNEVTGQLQELQAGDTARVGADLEIAGDLVISGTVDGADIAALAALVATALQPADISAVGASGADSDDLIEGTVNLLLTVAERAKLGFLTITQAVDLDTLETAIATLQTAETDRLAVTTGITAHAGGGFASAVELTTRYNVVATVATTADSVKLPAATAGLQRTVRNNGANAMDLFPGAGDSINAAGVDTAISVAAGTSLTLFCANDTNWYSE